MEKRDTDKFGRTNFIKLPSKNENSILGLEKQYQNSVNDEIGRTYGRKKRSVRDFFTRWTR